jgi:IS30 family transposase
MRMMMMMMISHETIYTSLFVQAKQVLWPELTTHLRTRRVLGRPQRRTSVSSGPGRMPARTRNAARPADVLDRTVAGHWEATCSSAGTAAVI